MAVKIPIFSSLKETCDQDLKKKKTHFPKRIFDKRSLKVGEHEYIYITEIKVEEKIHLRKWRPNHFLSPDAYLC